MVNLFKEHLSRSIAKSITFRLLVTISNLVVIYLVTGEMKLVFTVVLITGIANTAWYFLHERVWDRIYWGRKYFKKV